MIQPLAGRAIITPLFISEQRAEDFRKRTGLLYEPKHDNKTSFEGVPKEGLIKVLPAGYVGELNIGDKVVFDDKSPAGLTHEGEKLLVIKLENIVAKIEN